MRRALTLGIAGILIVLSGCASSPESRSQTARAPRAKPASVHAPQQLWLAVASPTDADGNGYADTFQVIVYLFPDREISAIPVWADGRFDFLLRSPEGKLIDRWVFGQESSEKARQRLAPGPGYSFFLRLSGGLDVREPVVATLHASFTPVDDSPRLEGGGAASVRLGGS